MLGLYVPEDPPPPSDRRPNADGPDEPRSEPAEKTTFVERVLITAWIVTNGLLSMIVAFDVVKALFGVAGMWEHAGRAAGWLALNVFALVAAAVFVRKAPGE